MSLHEPLLAGPIANEIADLELFADDPSAILALNEGTGVFRSPRVRGFIAYRRSGRWLIQIGGAHAAEGDRFVLINDFGRYAARQSGRVLAVQLQRRDAEDHHRCGYTVNQFGASYALSVATFGLRGKHFMQLRNKISRARRAGVVVEMTTYTDLAAGDRRRLTELDGEWLRAKGRHTKPLRFMVGELGGRGGSLRRLVVGRVDGRIVGYASLSPVFGERRGWLYDLSRRSHDAPPGVMELLVLSSIDMCAAEGAPWWHFGFTPFTGLDPSGELPSASPTVQRLVRLLADHGQAIYPAASQVDFKQKWGSPIILPDYVAFKGRPSLAGIARLIQVANLI